MKKTRISLIVLALLFLAAIWFLRPLGVIHGPVMYFYQYPLVFWLPVFSLALVWIAALFFAKRNQRAYKGLSFSQAMREISPGTTLASVGVGITMFFVGMIIAPILTGQAIYNEYKPSSITSLPSSGETRIMPKEVSEVLARNGFSSPTEALENGHIIRTPEGLAWTFGQSPDGVFRKITKKTQGTASLPADKTSRDLSFTEKEFIIAPGHVWADSITWKAYKKHFFTDVAESIYLPESGKILVPYVGYKGFLVKVPYLKGAYLVSADGTIEDLSPEEAALRSEIAESGRLFPENLARRIQDSYKYVHGIWNRIFTHRDILVVEDSDIGNAQPHYLDIDNRGTWVSVAEPWGRSDAIGGIFFTDALSGKTRLWRAAKDSGLTSSRKAIDATKALAIPGISFRAGDFEAIEPRPIFRNGEVKFLVSIIPGTRSTVSKSVIIDPRSNKAIQVFSHNTDADADQKLADYLAGKGVGSLAVSDEGAAKGSQVTPREKIEKLLEENARMKEALESLLEEYK